MKTATLFSAYAEARNEMSTWLIARRTNYGISMQTDKPALRWQRYARLAGKLDKKIRERLAGETQRKLADAERLAELGQRLLDEAEDYGRGWTVEEFLENEPFVKQFREALAAWVEDGAK